MLERNWFPVIEETDETDEIVFLETDEIDETKLYNYVYLCQVSGVWDVSPTSIHYLVNLSCHVLH